MSTTHAPISHSGDHDQASAAWEEPGFPLVRASGPDALRRAVDAAQAAFDEWSGWSASARRDVIYAAAGLLEQRGERFARYVAGAHARRPGNQRRTHDASGER
jgi:acyl-CoA reductase-like NAD-dependent aldehyde dehydrogenase